MSKITDTVWALAEPIAEANGCTVWDVEYVREAGSWFLRVYIDNPDGVSINQCEAVSRQLDPILDEKDPIPTSYTFEVSSAGLERALKRPSDFARFMGSPVAVHLYRPLEGRKEYTGRLLRYEDGAVTILDGETERTFAPKETAGVRLRME